MQSVTLERYTVALENGREVVIRNVPALQCQKCSETAFWPDVSRLLIHLGEASEHDDFEFPSTGDISPEEIRAVRRDLMLSQARMADMLGTQKNTYALWEQGRRHPTGPSRMLIRLMSILAQPISRMSSWPVLPHHEVELDHVPMGGFTEISALQQIDLMNILQDTYRHHAGIQATASTRTAIPEPECVY